MKLKELLKILKKLNGEDTVYVINNFTLKESDGVEERKLNDGSLIIIK